MSTLCKGGIVRQGSCRNCRTMPMRIVGVSFVGAEFLPAGEWITGNGNGNGASKTSSPVIVDPVRLAFMESLGPIHKIVNIMAFNGDREYEAFIVKAASGKLVAILETATTSNATYLFDADKKDWPLVASREKLDVLTGSYPSFLGRLYHGGKFATRLKDQLARL